MTTPYAHGTPAILARNQSVSPMQVLGIVFPEMVDGVPVAGAPVSYAALDPSATDGRQIAVAVAATGSETADAVGAILIHSGSGQSHNSPNLAAEDLIWPANISDDDQSGALASLRSRGVIA